MKFQNNVVKQEWLAIVFYLIIILLYERWQIYQLILRYYSKKCLPTSNNTCLKAFIHVLSYTEFLVFMGNSGYRYSAYQLRAKLAHLSSENIAFTLVGLLMYIKYFMTNESVPIITYVSTVLSVISAFSVIILIFNYKMCDGAYKWKCKYTQFFKYLLLERC